MADFNPFATEVINISLNGVNEPNYLPAPGQFVNNQSFNKAYRALGSPTGAGYMNASNRDIVTLGGFGGKIVLSFDHNVENNPANPMGLDAIVFSNAWYYAGYPNYRWSEPATIEIMPELNDNNIPGDDPCEIWYLIPGSNLDDPNTFRTIIWDINDPNVYGYPDFNDSWPVTYETSAFEIFPNFQCVGGDPPYCIWLLVNPNIEDPDPYNDNLEGFWGYAEYSPTLKLGDLNVDDINDGFGDCPNMPPELFYTVPDDPFTVGILPGTCGGDAFDIDWAVNPDTWQPANLVSFKYIRITNPVHEMIGEEGILGESSPEIDAVADVRPVGDINGDNEIDYYDIELFTKAWLTEWPDPCFNPAADFAVDHKIDLFDYAEIARGWVLNSQY